MARYIDADKMVSEDNAYTTFPHDLAGCDDTDLVRWINEQPTADVAPKSAWISVDERLPDESCECLTVSESGAMYILLFSCRYKAFNAHDKDGGDRWKLGCITHWMPLPEPPKGVADDGSREG